MARPLRVELPGALYHITSRGNAGEPIFLDDRDRSAFLEILGEVVKRYRFRCYAYCLMGNHYHLLIEAQEGNLSRGMRQLNGVYSPSLTAGRSGLGGCTAGSCPKGRGGGALEGAQGRGDPGWGGVRGRTHAVAKGKEAGDRGAAAGEAGRKALLGGAVFRGQAQEKARCTGLQAVMDHGYRLKEVGEHLGLHCSTDSRI
ncbi:transposase, partial [Candidatus Bipolaricaulota bacterium]|nr:transposase [Candidatus Bipolaricaulota bacterium]